MRLLKDLPELETALKSGALSLSNASALQHFFKKEEKSKSYSQDQKKTVVQETLGKSRRECDKMLAGLAPTPERQEQSRPISATQTEIRFTATQETRP